MTSTQHSTQTSTQTSTQPRTPHCTIVPPYMLEALAASDEPAVAGHARAALGHDEQLRATRHTPTTRPTSRRPPRREDGATPTAHGTGPHRTIADAHGTQTTPGTTVRTEGDAASDDVAVNEAYDGLGATWEL